MSTPWSPRQQKWLAALGYTVYGVAPVPAAPLQHALLRAAGRDAAAADARAVLRGLPAPGVLRGDARAKRALWPRLRAMRRGRPA